MRKEKTSSDDSGCLWIIIVFFMCLYTCENRGRIDKLDERLNKIECVKNCE